MELRRMESILFRSINPFHFLCTTHVKFQLVTRPSKATLGVEVSHQALCISAIDRAGAMITLSTDILEQKKELFLSPSASQYVVGCLVSQGY